MKEAEINAAGRDRAQMEWMRHGFKLLQNKKLYGEVVKKIDPGIRRTFDRTLAQIAADSRTIFRPKVRR
jgi:hypothetical protein